MALPPKIATASTSREIFLVLGITGHFPMILALLHRHSHSSEKFLDSFPHTILTGIVTTTLATARNDDKRRDSHGER